MLKIVLSLVLAVFVVFCFCNLLPLLNASPTQQGVFRGVLDLWHVETFEGGSSSRKSWLNSVARQFEKANKGIYVCVTTYTHQQAIDKLSAGESFDLVSFSVGTGNALLACLRPLETSTQYVLDNFLTAGSVGNTQYALAYSTGFYALFARQKHLDTLGIDDLVSNASNCGMQVKVGKNKLTLASLGWGTGEFNSPLSALGGNEKGCSKLTQYQAYEQFVGGKNFVVLLGTQRDVYRLSNKVSQGKIDDLAFSVLPSYTDLVQYVGISNSAGQKTEYCQSFVEHLASKSVQLSLSDIYLLSPTNLTVYADGWMKQAQDCLPNFYVPNAFVDSVLLHKGE